MEPNAEPRLDDAVFNRGKRGRGAVADHDRIFFCAAENQRRRGFIDNGVLRQDRNIRGIDSVAERMDDVFLLVCEIGRRGDGEGLGERLGQRVR